MMTNLEASLKMDSILSRMQEFFSKTGYIYPMLVLLHKGSPLNIEVKDPSVIYNDTGKVESEEEDIHVTTVAFKNEKDGDMATMERVCLGLIRKYKPDVAGYLMSAVYKTFSLADYKKLPAEYQAELDPDSLRVLTLGYYLRGDRRSNIRVIPFVDRTGPVKEPDSDLQEVLGEDAPQPERNIIFMDTPWRTGDESLEPWLKYPY